MEINLKELSLNDYCYITYDKVRYRDTDRQGHVNNALFSTFLETGRVEILWDPHHPVSDFGCSFVIASLNLDMINEIYWPGQVDIGTSVIHIGNSSFKIIQGLFQQGKLVGTATSILVQTNDITRKSQKLSDEAKAKLKKYYKPYES